MAAILLVVGNAASPTTGDALIKTILEGMGYTVTYVSDEAAEDVTGMDGVVIAESVAGATLGSKYATVAVPVVALEQAYLDDMGFCTTADIGQQATQTQVSWLSTTHPIADGPFGTFSGTTTIFGSPATLGRYDFTGGGAGSQENIASITADSTIIVCAACDEGTSLLIGNAAAKRAFIWPQDAASASLNSDGTNVLKNAFAWAFGFDEVVATGRRYKRFYGPAQLGATAATLYTAPSSARATIRQIFANNPSGSPVDVTLSIGADGASTRIVDEVSIAAGDAINMRRLAHHTLAAGEMLQGFASSGGTVVLTVNGVEEFL